MRIRGRRVALILAGAIQLLADEAEITPPPEETTTPETIINEINNNENLRGDENDENDHMDVAVPLTAVEAIHDDGFQKIRSLPKADLVIDADEITKVDSSIIKAEEEGLPQDETHDDDLHEVENDDTIIEESHNESTDILDVDIQNHERSSQEETESESINTDDDELESDETEGQQNNETSSSEDSMDSNAEELVQPDDEEPSADSSQNETIPEENVVDEESPAENAVDDEDEESLQNRVSVDYASKSAGALIIEKSKGFKGTSSLLNGDKDKYAIAPCEDKKFVIISLSEEILVKTIRIANYERFSSTVKDFQVLGSQTLDTWVDLGTYSAAPGNGEQVFDLVEPSWARYLNFKFLSHHGVEYYCTYSQIQVHGSTMAQGFHEHWDEEESDESDINEDGYNIETNEETGITGGNPNDGDIADGIQLDKEESNGEAETDKASTNDAEEDQPRRQESERTNASPGNEPASTMESTDLTSPSFTSVGQFHSSENLDAMLHGRIDDGVLLSEIFDLIPSTLMTLPSVSRESPGRKASYEGRLQSFHNLGSEAINSLSAPFKDAAEEVSEAYATGTIVAPKMSDAVDEMFRFGRDLAARIAVHHASEADSTTDSETSETSIIPEKAASSQQESEEEDVETSDSDEIKSTEKEEQEAPHLDVHLENKKESQTQQEPTTKTTSSQGDAMEGTSSIQNGNGEAARDHASSNSVLDHIEENSLILAAIQTELPSADCLRSLNFTEMKIKAIALRKSSSGGGPGQSNAAMEPIFKKLTDEIKSLQTSLSVHEQYAKSLTACYQRVLLDLMAESERRQNSQEERLLRLEEEFKKSQSFFLIRIARWLFQFASAAFAFIYHGLYSLVLVFSSQNRPSSAEILRQVWPNMKKGLFSWKAGAVFVNLLSPILLSIDRLLDGFQSDQSKHDQASLVDEEPHDQTDWKSTITTVIVTVVVCRVAMFCTTSYTKRIQAKEKSEASLSRKVEADASIDQGVPELANEISPNKLSKNRK